MNSRRGLELEELRQRLEEIRCELERIAEDERFGLGCGEPVSECCYEEAESAIYSVDDAASRVDDAIELIYEAINS